MDRITRRRADRPIWEPDPPVEHSGGVGAVAAGPLPGDDRTDEPAATAADPPDQPPPVPDPFASTPRRVPTTRRLRLAEVVTPEAAAVWRRRIILAVAAGLAFTFLFEWRAGVTAAVLAAVVDAVYRARRRTGTGQAPPTGAQRRTMRQLARLERAGYRALHTRVIPGSTELIDHLVVGPTGVYAIDSEQWDRRLPVRTKRARQLWHGPFSKQDRLSHAKWEAREASRRLSAELGTDVPVRPAMAVYGPRIPWLVMSINGVDVLSGGRLRTYLRKDVARSASIRLSPAEVERIHAAAARVLPSPAQAPTLR